MSNTTRQTPGASWRRIELKRATGLLSRRAPGHARLARILLAGLPPVLKVGVRGSNAGVWLEASLRYALAEARSPRPDGQGVLAKLAEVLFIEVLRIHMNEQADGRTGGLTGVGDASSAPRCACCMPTRNPLDAGCSTGGRLLSR